MKPASAYPAPFSQSASRREKCSLVCAFTGAPGHSYSAPSAGAFRRACSGMYSLCGRPPPCTDRGLSEERCLQGTCSPHSSYGSIYHSLRAMSNAGLHSSAAKTSALPFCTSVCTVPEQPARQQPKTPLFANRSAPEPCARLHSPLLFAPAGFLRYNGAQEVESICSKNLYLCF